MPDLPSDRVARSTNSKTELFNKYNGNNAFYSNGNKAKTQIKQYSKVGERKKREKAKNKSRKRSICFTTNLKETKSNKSQMQEDKGKRGRGKRKPEERINEI